MDRSARAAFAIRPILGDMDTAGDYRPPHLAAVAQGPGRLLVCRCEDCSARFTTTSQEVADDWVRVHSRGDLKVVR